MVQRPPKKRIPWVVRRKTRLLMDGFLQWELHRFRGVHKLRCLLDYPLSRPYIKRMRIARRVIFNEAKDKRFTMAEYKREIVRLYKKMGWVDKDGKPDVWAMLRFFYRLSIQQDDYTPPPKKKKKWSKGDVQAQRQRYKEKQEARKRMGISVASQGDKGITTKDWIRVLELAKKRESNPDRIRQYEAQIKRLRGAV